MRNMPSEKEISSTEKLLDVIRGQAAPLHAQPSTEAASKPAAEAQPTKARSRRSFSPKALSFRKQITLGVDIGHTELRLAKVAQISDQRLKLLAYAVIPYKPGVSIGNPKFLEMLKGAVTEMAGSSRKVHVWAIMSAAQVDVRHLRIPKVPRKQLYNAVYWTAKKEMTFDEKESLFDFEVQGEIQEKGITKTSVMVSIIPRQEIKAVRDLFVKSSIHLTGITIAPFALQNLFRTRWVPTAENAVASLYLGNNFSRIDIYHKGSLVLTRGIKTGLNSMIESLIESYSEGRSAEIAVEILDGGQLTVPMVLEQSREMTREEAFQVLFSLSSECQLPEEGESGFCLSESQIMDMIRPALHRLVRQIERTFQHYLTLPGSDAIGQVYVSGVVTTCLGIVDYIGQQLGIGKDPLDPLSPTVLPNSDVLPPAALSERVKYTAALGLALSDNSRTPNALFSFQEKERQERVARINRSILLGFFVLMGCLLSVFFWQNYTVGKKQALIAQLQGQLASFSTHTDESTILKMAAKVKQQQQILKQKSRHYLMLAVIGDLASFTPPNIRLVNVSIDFGPVQAKQPKPGSEVLSKPGQEMKSAQPSRTLVLEGIVTGDQQLQESSLASYIMKIEASPIFFNPSIHSSAYETRQTEGEVLHFTLKIGII